MQIELLESKAGHWYKVTDYYPEPVVVPSFTTVLGATVPKPWLGPWARKMERLHIRDVLYRHVIDGETLTPGFIDKILAEASEKPETAASSAADIGTRAHKAIESIIKGGSTPVITPDIEPCVNGYLAWAKETGMKVISSELMIFSPSLRTAGTLDGIGERAGKRVLLDWKTAKSIYAEHAYQVGGYSIGLAEIGKPVDEAWIIRFPKTSEDSPFEAKQVKNLAIAQEGFRLFRRQFDLQKINPFKEDQQYELGGIQHITKTGRGKATKSKTK